LNPAAPIRSRAPEEGNFQIPLWGIPFILLLLYVCLFSGLGALGLVGPDEPRYAAIARAMAETHDWITPRLWGTPWFEKPVLYYWTAGIAMRLFGVNEFAARLPSAVAALLAVAAIKWTALRCYGLGTAWYALLMLPTSVAMIGFSRAAAPDMLFAGLLTAAMAVACEMLQKPRPGSIQRIAFGFFLGAAVLAKGPAAVILAGGATLLWAALTNNWRAPFRFLHPLVIAVFCATALPWYILCALLNPDFLRVFIWEHNFQRYLTPIFEHRQPFWFFLPVFLLGILPWLPLLFAGFYDAVHYFHSEKNKNSPTFFLACWVLFTLFFFSFSQSKLPGYILPSIPPAVLLIARSFARQIEQPMKGMRLLLASVAVLFPVLIGIAGARLLQTIGGWKGFFIGGERSGVLVGIVTAVLGGALIAGFSLSRKWNAALCVEAGTIAMLVLIANGMVMPRVDELISVRSVAAGLSRMYDVKSNEIAVYQLPRDYKYGLNYYFGKDLPEWSSENTNAPILIFTVDSDIYQEIRSRGFLSGQASVDGKIWWAWKSDRPKRPIFRF
jgi:4-amino-4-deoxy-L-arabinose transferase-like glycosyltransferase